MRKLLICTPLGTFSAFHYMFYIYLSGYNSKTIQDVKFKFSAFLSLVEATKYAKFQSARCTGLKVGIFRKSPINLFFFFFLNFGFRFSYNTRRYCLQ